jgi:hypothetical protein
MADVRHWWAPDNVPDSAAFSEEASHWPHNPLRRSQARTFDLTLNVPGVY